VKGTSLAALHHDPDRVDHPLKRVGDRWERISWDRAVSEIGERVRALRRDHGDRSTALYTGNPTFFSFQHLLFAEAFLTALGSPNHFASHSIDVNNTFFVSTEVYGAPTVHPVPDLDRVRFLMVLGSNPAVSQMSVLNVPDALGRLRGIEARGGRVVIVDPRRTETAAEMTRHRTLVGGWPRVAAAVPVGALAEEIAVDHPERNRALLVTAGNPVHSVPGDELAGALAGLELVVCIDIYPNETSRFADYLLPATDMLERSDYPIAWANLLPALNGLLSGLPGDLEITSDHLLALLFRWGGRVTLPELRARPGGVLLPPTEPGSFLGCRVPTPDRRMRLAPASILRDLRRLRSAEASFTIPDDGTLVLMAGVSAAPTAPGCTATRASPSGLRGAGR